MDTVVLGGAAGAWGDSALSTGQLLASGRCDFILYEALAEITMAILARAKAKDPSLGYTTDVIEMIAMNLPAIRSQGIRVVTNAGGLNVHAAAARLREAAAVEGLDVRIGVVEGDALTAQALEGLTDTEDGEALHPRTITVNAYLGALPIAAAFDAGADIVITGRCADSALALGPLIHCFKWKADDFDRLSAGSLAGHLLECSTQSTGGSLTDWEDVPSWENLGYPMAECASDGSFVLTKPDGTGGLVDKRTVSEQLVYEIGDPRTYILPDVVCDWSEVTLEEVGPDRVKVSGAKGRGPTPTLKATALHVDGFKLTSLLGVAGRDAVAKAERMAKDVRTRINRVLEQGKWGALRDVDVELLGAESTYGPQARATTREVVLKMSFAHDDAKALAALVREIPSFGLAVPGVLSGGTGLPRPSPIVQLRSYLVPRERVSVSASVDGRDVEAWTVIQGEPLTMLAPDDKQTVESDENVVSVPLVAIAYARSGDKGRHSNIGVIARDARFLPRLTSFLTAARVREWFAHRVDGRVERYALPGLGALNFVMYDALGGGGVASLRFDPQGKAYGQQLLDMPIDVPKDWLDMISQRRRC